MQPFIASMAVAASTEGAFVSGANLIERAFCEHQAFEFT